jgi:hypothetical protein
MRHYGPMGSLILLCGVIAALAGTWRGYENARIALAPLIHDGDPTRTAIEANQPFLARPRVRRVAGSLGLSIGWLAVAMYGLYLAASGAATGR